MDVKWDAPLKPGQLTNPVVEFSTVDLAGVPLPEVDDMLAIFNPAKHSLKTWGRKPGVLEDDPHWIGVCKQTPLHVDPRYPPFTHHLMMIVDRFALRGVDKHETPLTVGTYVVTHTHSPHQLFALEKEAKWYLAVSIDAKRHLPRDEVIPKLLEYARTAVLLTDDIVMPNVGGRFVRTA